MFSSLLAAWAVSDVAPACPLACPTCVQGAGGMSQQQALQKDALPSPPASPLAKRPPSAGGEQVAAAGSSQWCVFLHVQVSHRLKPLPDTALLQCLATCRRAGGPQPARHQRCGAARPAHERQLAGGLGVRRSSIPQPSHHGLPPSLLYTTVDRHTLPCVLLYTSLTHPPQPLNSRNTPRSSP